MSVHTCAAHCVEYRGRGRSSRSTYQKHRISEGEVKLAAWEGSPAAEQAGDRAGCRPAQMEWGLDRGRGGHTSGCHAGTTASRTTPDAWSVPHVRVEGVQAAPAGSYIS